MTNLNDCRLLELYQDDSPFYYLKNINNCVQLPFMTKRIFYLYDIPEGAERGGHAHKTLYQILIAINGSFEVIVKDEKEKKTFELNRPSKCLLLVPGIWREMNNFSKGAICMVLASSKYDSEDYIRDFSEFRIYRNAITQINA